MAASSVIALMSITRPSTIPALNVKTGFSFAYLVSAFANATGTGTFNSVPSPFKGAFLYDGKFDVKTP